MAATKRTRRGSGAKGEARGGLAVTIEGFKSIVGQTIELGRLNVLVGANGSGKTAFLEAIGVLAAAAEGHVDDAHLRWKGVRASAPTLFVTSLADVPVRSDIRLRARSAGAEYAVRLDLPDPARAVSSWRFAEERVSEGGEDLLRRTRKGSRGEAGAVPRRKRGAADVGDASAMLAFGALPEAANRLLQALIGFVIYDPQAPVLRGLTADPWLSHPIGLRGGGLATAIKALRTADGGLAGIERDVLFSLLEWASEVRVGPPTAATTSAAVPTLTEILEFVDPRMRAGNNVVSASDASEGALHVLFALATVLHPDAPRLFAIENFDHALHPRLARALVRLLGEVAKTTRRRILLTTHLPTSLDGLVLSDDDVRLFIVDRTVGGETVIRRVAYDDALAKAEESGLTLSQLWVQGSLGGGVPNIW